MCSVKFVFIVVCISAVGCLQSILAAPTTDENLSSVAPAEVAIMSANKQEAATDLLALQPEAVGDLAQGAKTTREKRGVYWGYPFGGLYGAYAGVGVNVYPYTYPTYYPSYYGGVYPYYGYQKVIVG